MRKVWVQYFPKRVPALDLLVADDLAGLRELHRRERTLERLGQDYAEPDA